MVSLHITIDRPPPRLGVGAGEEGAGRHQVVARNGGPRWYCDRPWRPLPAIGHDRQHACWASPAVSRASPWV